MPSIEVMNREYIELKNIYQRFSSAKLSISKIINNRTLSSTNKLIAILNELDFVSRIGDYVDCSSLMDSYSLADQYYTFINSLDSYRAALLNYSENKTVINEEIARNAANNQRTALIRYENGIAEFNHVYNQQIKTAEDICLAISNYTAKSINIVDCYCSVIMSSSCSD